MALKPERQVHQTNMDHVLLQAAEPGVVLCTSGVQNSAIIAGTGEVGVSGIWPLGLLLNTREAHDYGKEYERFNYDTDDLGTVVTILKEGELTTDQVEGTVVAGQIAFLAVNGQLSAVNPADTGAGSENRDFAVGRFLSAADANGFVKVHVQVM